MGAGRVGKLVFLGQIGVRGHTRTTLRRLGQALAQHGLRLEDLLRLRIFVVDLGAQAEIERALEELLPRDSWPAITIVELSPRDDQAVLSLDAIAAPDAHLAQRQIGPLEHDRAKERCRPEAVRYGPWVFVGAVVGESSLALSFPQRIEAQARSLFAQIEKLLRATGAGLGDVIDVGGWLTFPMSRYEPLGAVRSQMLAEHGLLPASAAVQVGRVAGDGEPLLSFEAIAFAPHGDTASSVTSDAVRSPLVTDQHKPSQQVRHLARTSPLAAYYATARHAGGYVFTCGEIPRTRTGYAQEQVGDVYEQLRSHLAEHDADPSGVVHQTVFVRNREDIPAVQAAGRAFCGSETPTTLIQAADMGFRPGVDVEIKLVAKSREQRAER